MSVHEKCGHGISLGRDADGNPFRCLDCELIWHKDALRRAKDEAEGHSRIVRKLLAEKSRLCGDA